MQGEVDRTDQALVATLNMLAADDAALTDDQRQVAKVLRLGVMKGIIDFLVNAQDDLDRQAIESIAARRSGALQRSFAPDPKRFD